MSETVEIVKIVVGAGCTMFLAYLAYMGNKIQQGQQDAAVEVRKVRKDLKANEKVTKATHTLVNSDRSALLKVVATALRRVANDSDHPEDIAAAKLAEQAYEAHQAAQAEVDAQPGTDAEKRGDA